MNNKIIVHAATGYGEPENNFVPLYGSAAVGPLLGGGL
jgi:hypothetical protein